MGAFLILTANGKTECDGNVLRIGRGKRAVDVIGISKGDYMLFHIPSGYALTFHGYDYLSTAKTIGNEIVELMGNQLLDPYIKPEAFSQELQMYLKERFFDLKVPPTLEEWLNGPDFERSRDDSNPGEHLPSGSLSEDDRQLQAWDRTLAWVPSGTGTLSAGELGCLIEGKPFSQQSIHTILK